MQILYCLLIIAVVVGLVYLVHRYGQVKVFRLKILKLISTKLKLESSQSNFYSCWELYHKHNFFDYLFSFKNLKLHMWFTREETRLLNAPNEQFLLIKQDTLDTYFDRVIEKSPEEMHAGLKDLLVSLKHLGYIVLQDEIETENEEFNRSYR